MFNGTTLSYFVYWHYDILEYNIESQGIYLGYIWQIIAVFLPSQRCAT